MRSANRQALVLIAFGQDPPPPYGEVRTLRVGETLRKSQPFKRPKGVVASLLAAGVNFLDLYPQPENVSNQGKVTLVSTSTPKRESTVQGALEAGVVLLQKADGYDVVWRTKTSTEPLLKLCNACEGKEGPPENTRTQNCARCTAECWKDGADSIGLSGLDIEVTRSDHPYHFSTQQLATYGNPGDLIQRRCGEHDNSALGRQTDSAGKNGWKRSMALEIKVVGRRSEDRNSKV